MTGVAAGAQVLIAAHGALRRGLPLADGLPVHLPAQRTSAFGASSHVVVVYGGRLATSLAVDALADRDWSLGSVTEIDDGAWRVVLLPRD